MKKILSLFLSFSVLFLGSVFAFENVSWSATTLEAGAESTYTFEFTTTADVSDPYVWIHFPVGFNTTPGFVFYGYHSPSSIDISINGGTGFYQYNGSSSWNPLRFLLGLHPNPIPDPIASGSLVQISISHILNPSSVGSYSWNDLFYYGESNNYNPQDYSIALSDIEIFAYTPFDRCDTNSGSINIPYQECVGLAYLYTETNGDGWHTKTNWFSSTDVTTWENRWTWWGSSYYSGDVNFQDLGPYALVLSGDAGDGKSHIYALNLYNNTLQGSIQSGLAYFPELNYLVLQSNNITDVDLSFNPKLKLLDLSYNYSFIPSSLDVSALPDLEYLDLNSLGVDDVVFGDTQNIYYLQLRHNNFISLNLVDFPSLIYLGVRNNQLTSINFSNLPNLYEISLRNNQLTSIDLSNLSNLYEINLRNNQLTSIDLSDLLNLYEIDLRDNQLTSIDLSDLPNLYEISLRGNQLTSIDLSDLPNLYDVSLRDNQLTSIDLSDLPNLYDVSLRDNQLTSIDLSNLPNLYEISLRGNQLTSLTISGLPNLRWLPLRDNQLTSLTLSNLPNLREISASNNMLSEDGFTFHPLYTGNIDIYLNNNRFTTIPSSFLSLDLWDLQMASNCLDVDAFDGATLAWLDNNVGWYDISNQKYCVSIDLDGTIQGEASVQRTQGSFGGNSRGAVSDIEVIRNGFLGDYFGLRGESDQEIVYTWIEPVTVSAVHAYWQAGGNSQAPGSYFFSYRDTATNNWITPSEWEAGSGDQDFQTQHVFTLDTSVTTTGVRLFRPDECCENGIGLSQFLVYGPMEEEGEPTRRTGPGGGSRIAPDYCPDGDFSGSYYDGSCGPEISITERVVTSLVDRWADWSTAQVQQTLDTLSLLNDKIQEKESVSESMKTLFQDIIDGLLAHYNG